MRVFVLHYFSGKSKAGNDYGRMTYCISPDGKVRPALRHGEGFSRPLESFAEPGLPVSAMGVYDLETSVGYDGKVRVIAAAMVEVRQSETAASK